MTNQRERDLVDGEVLAFVRTAESAEGYPLESSDRIPSLQAARFASELTNLAGLPVSARTLAFVAQCRRGEAFAFEREGDLPTLPGTYYALRVLTLAGKPWREPATTRWITERLFDDRGRLAVGMDELFYGARALMLLEADLPQPARKEILEFLRARRSPEGGYGPDRGEPADIQRTYCAISLRGWLHDGARVEEDEGLAEWIVGCHRDGRMHLSPSSGEWSLGTAASGHRCADVLGLAWPWNEAREFAESHRREDGGFGLGAASTLWETYCGLRTIQLADEHNRL
ncbi:prenyltransferase/squalene oxidase repeat-containing protein [Amycolatopsis halotolerans]|uniref:Prenyltransferase/squalene oxidase repeat-containing protein n=1 Tax=Amycolatopsis halotolerans TaxID=330083 RepID=A0ABV7QFE7_9PSEU